MIFRKTLARSTTNPISFGTKIETPFVFKAVPKLEQQIMWGAIKYLLSVLQSGNAAACVEECPRDPGKSRNFLAPRLSALKPNPSASFSKRALQFTPNTAPARVFAKHVLLAA
mmetsp:Transcript_17309/g.35588  ORF Transcript_17309/g.35588 Transcript_17309/m.35588 type:complete len:113 (+) Transcript_17309:110-448(+)